MGAPRTRLVLRIVSYRCWRRTLEASIMAICPPLYNIL